MYGGKSTSPLEPNTCIKAPAAQQRGRAGGLGPEVARAAWENPRALFQVSSHRINTFGVRRGSLGAIWE